MSESLGFAPEILRRLGEELVPHSEQGIVELVRNAYDADATTCTIELSAARRSGGTIIVTDNGDGISRSAITDGWLVIGRSGKKRTKPTGLSRTPAGDKGLGRLAGLRLGSCAILRTRPKAEPGTEYTVELDWNKFDRARVVEDVKVIVKKGKTDEPCGTTIELRRLRSGLNRHSVKRLARALVLLSDPFKDSEGFRPVLRAKEFKDLEKTVSDGYFDDVEYQISAELHSDGTATASVLDWRGKPRFVADHTRLARARLKTTKNFRYSAPPAKFDLWVFKLSGDTFSTKKSTLTEVREWLDVVGGVHVYQHKLRVPPYGDSGEDWLDLNLRRARNPQHRPSTNNSIGRVVVDSNESSLIQKTDRSGFLENTAFTDLRSFCQDVLDWSGSEHLRVADEKRRKDRAKAEKEMGDARDAAETVQTKLDESEDEAAKKAFSDYQRAVDKQLAALREDVLLYRTLGTVGTTSSAFAHESVKPASRIQQGVKLTRSAGKKQFGDDFDLTVGRQLDVVERAAGAIAQWSQLPLQLLKRDKRRSRMVDLRESVEEVEGLLGPFIEEAKTELLTDTPDEAVEIYGPPAALESIIANLVLNSLRAVLEMPTDRRTISISLQIEVDPPYADLSVADSGAGFQGIDIQDIWLPGRTTFEYGTGLGLTIVLDSATDLGGSVDAIASGRLGGAEFVVNLPLVESST